MKWRLVWAILRHPTYSVIISATSVLPPSPWAFINTMEVIVRHDHKTILVEGDLV